MFWNMKIENSLNVDHMDISERIRAWRIGGAHERFLLKEERDLKYELSIY